MYAVGLAVGVSHSRQFDRLIFFLYFVVVFFNFEGVVRRHKINTQRSVQRLLWDDYVFTIWIFWHLTGHVQSQTYVSHFSFMNFNQKGVLVTIFYFCKRDIRLQRAMVLFFENLSWKIDSKKNYLKMHKPKVIGRKLKIIDADNLIKYLNYTVQKLKILSICSLKIHKHVGKIMRAHRYIENFTSQVVLVVVVYESSSSSKPNRDHW